MQKTILFFCITLFLLCSGIEHAQPQSKYLAAAVGAERWIDSLKFANPDCQTWAANERLYNIGYPTLYEGTSGIILFYLELYQATGAKEYLANAERGAKYMCQGFPIYSLYERMGYMSEQVFSLYTGEILGVAYPLYEVFKATGNPFYREQALKYIQYLVDTFKKQEKNKDWFDTTDVVAGSAGIGLFMIYLNRELKEPQYLQTAEMLGNLLLEAAQPLGDGVRWAMSEDDKKRGYFMPNFSHGTAGISYFLARLYQETGNEKYLKAALAGAKHLESIANGECLVYHVEPDGKDRHYLGWCHGPVGTGRLYYALWKITGETQWLDKLKKSAKAVMSSGIPEKQTPGFWNNVSVCCGSAGIALYFLNLYDALGDEGYLAFARRMADDLLAKAVKEGNGLKWPQAEHRKYPDFLLAQTGYMQGASGIGVALLHLAEFEKKQKARIVLPDSPFAY